MAVSLWALHLAHIKKNRSEARKALESYVPDRPWARLTLLRVEREFGDWEATAKAAEACLADAPDQVHALECARAIASAREFERSAQVARQLARESGDREQAELRLARAPSGT
jgi:hypothetical protein